MNKLIVESKNDKAFIEALIRHLNVAAEVDEPIFIDDFESLDGLNPTKLTVKLSDVFSEVAKSVPQIEKIGILLDVDNEGFDKRLQLVNECLQKTTAKISRPIEAMNQLIQVEIEGVCQILRCQHRAKYRLFQFEEQTWQLR